ncbi:MAG: hypothetical protein ACW981_07690 [Candidatus Hodarchaeales archaeon]|jgi:hypothetical protein
MINQKTNNSFFHAAFFLFLFLLSLPALQSNSDLIVTSDSQNLDENNYLENSKILSGENFEIKSLSASLPVEVDGDVKDNGDGSYDFTYSIRSDDLIDSFLIYTADPTYENYVFPTLPPGWTHNIENVTVIRDEPIPIEMVALKLTSSSPVSISNGITFDFTYWYFPTLPFETSIGPAPWFAGLNQPSSQLPPTLQDYDVLGSSWMYLNDPDTLGTDPSSDWNGLTLPSIIPGPFQIYPENNLTGNIYNPAAYDLISFTSIVPSVPLSEYNRTTSGWNPTNITQHDTSLNNTACSPTAGGYILGKLFGDQLNSTFQGNETAIAEELIQLMNTTGTGSSLGSIPQSFKDFAKKYNLSVDISTYSPFGYNATHPGSGWAESPNITMEIIINEFITESEMIHFDVSSAGWAHTLVLVSLSSIPDNPPKNNRYKVQFLDPHTGKIHDSWFGVAPNGKVVFWYGGEWKYVQRVTKISPVQAVSSEASFYDPTNGVSFIDYKVAFGPNAESFSMYTGITDPTEFKVTLPNGWNWTLHTDSYPRLTVFRNLSLGQFEVDSFFDIHVEIRYDPSRELTLGQAPWTVGGSGSIVSPTIYPYVDLNKDVIDNSSNHLGDFDALIDGYSHIWSIIPDPIEIHPLVNVSNLIEPVANETLIPPTLSNSTFVKGNLTDFNPFNLTQHNTTAGNNGCSPTSMAYSLYWWLKNGVSGPNYGVQNTTDFGDFQKLVEDLIKRMGTNSSTGTTRRNITDGTKDFIDNHSLPLKVKTYTDDAWGDHGRPKINDLIHEFINNREDVQFGIYGPDWAHSMTLVGLSSTPENGTDWKYKAQIIDPWTGEIIETFFGLSNSGNVYVWYNGQWVLMKRMVAVSPNNESVDVANEVIPKGTVGEPDAVTGDIFVYKVTPRNGSLVDDLHIGPIFGFSEDNLTVIDLPDGWYWKIVNTSNGKYVSFYNNRTVDGKGKHLPNDNETEFRIRVNATDYLISLGEWVVTSTGLANPAGGNFSTPIDAKHPKIQSNESSSGIMDRANFPWIYLPSYPHLFPSTPIYDVSGTELTIDSDNFCPKVVDVVSYYIEGLDTSNRTFCGVITRPLYSSNFTLHIFAEDTFGNVEYQETDITVISNPHLFSSPSDITILQGSSETIEWTFLDSFPTTYTVTNSDALFDNGIWNSGESIKINLESLTLGSHEIVMTVQNANGFSTSDTVIVTVTSSSTSTSVSKTTSSSTGSTSQVSTSNLPIFFIILAVFSIAYLRKIRK